MIGIVLGTILYQFIDYFTGEDFELRLQESPVHSGLSMEAFLGTLIVMSIVNVPLWCLDMQLVFLHVYLMNQNLTTYEYIMNRKQQDEGISKFKGLPRCMDWIVFSRCGQKRRKKKDKIEKIDDTKPPPPDAEAGSQQPGEPDRPAPAEAPPGSTENDGSFIKQSEVEAALAASPKELGEGKLSLEMPLEEHVEADKMTGGTGANSEVALVEQCEVASGPTVGVPQVGCGCDGSSSLSHRDNSTGKAAV
mmetsp:Transcript_59806/g.107388  ORF Transcript_59806/g.107388 Transcript_59806/m.107388 type:complete len:249 (-) Transcript_59806:396-1142(-)